MKDNKLLKFITNHYLLFGITLIVLFMLSISTTYAKYIVQATQKDKQVGETDCFKLSFEENNNINLDNIIPISDEEGKKLTPYTFTIKNICKHTSKYTIELDVLNNSTLDLNFVKYQLNQNSPSLLSNASEVSLPTLDNAKTAISLYEDNLLYNESKTFNLRLWLDENTTVEQAQNKMFSSKIVIVSTLNKKYVTFNTNGGTLDKYSANLESGNLKTLPTPTKNGYTFNGWYTKENGGVLVTTSTKLNGGDKIHARWESNTYQLTYNYYDGVVFKDNPTSYNKESNITLFNPDKEGYEFTGWQEKIKNISWYEGFVDFNDGSIIENSSYPDAVYSDLLTIKKDEKIHVTELANYIEGNIRIRAYNINGDYIGNVGNSHYTATSDCLIRVMLLYKPTQEQRDSIVVQIENLKETATITPGTNGNRRFVANFKEDNSFMKIYQAGKTENYNGRPYKTKNQIVTLDEFDVEEKSYSKLTLDLKCGNAYADMTSTCTFYIDGYTNGEWEEITSKLKSRPSRTSYVTIFSGDESLPDKIYSKFRVRFKSTDEEVFIYAKIKGVPNQ